MQSLQKTLGLLFSAISFVSISITLGQANGQVTVQLNGTGEAANATSDTFRLDSVAENITEINYVPPGPVNKLSAEFFLKTGETTNMFGEVIPIWTKVGEHQAEKPLLTWIGTIDVSAGDFPNLITGDTHDVLVTCSSTVPGAHPYHADGVYEFKVRWYKHVQTSIFMGIWIWAGDDEKTITIPREGGGGGSGGGGTQGGNGN